jgi:predicted ATPase
MIQALDLAMKEGIIEKAGPVYTFSHDLLQESTYRLIPAHERNLMHKKIGASLVRNTQNAENSELCILAVDQINTSINLEGKLDPAERLLFARLNLVAGKHAMSARKSNYKQGKVIQIYPKLR